MLIRLRRALALAFALISIGAASARADTLAVTFSADPTEEVPVPITATWSSTDPSAAVFVTIKPSGPLGCGAAYSIDDPNSDDVMFNRGGTATGTTTANQTEGDPGAFTLCGYLQHGSSATTPLAATGPITLTVRAARATLGVTAPARVDLGQRFAISLPVTTELSRSLFLTVKPAGGRGCEATYGLDDPGSEDVIWSRGVQGTQTTSTDYTASTTAGTYLLCAYIQESSSDPAPEAAASTTYLVGPDPCVTAKGKLAAATRAVKTAESAVNRYRASSKRYARRAAHAHGAKRRILLRLAKRDKSRYASAVRRRAAARATLATAQAAVTAACG